MTPLHQFGQWLRDLFAQVPLGAVRFVFVGLLVLLLLWVLRLPREQTTPTDRPAGRGENLKIWAALALGLQILVYLWF